MPEILETGVTLDDLPLLSVAQLTDKFVVRRDGLDRALPLSLILALFTNGAPVALDTWLEVVQRLEDDQDALAAINSALANRLRFDAAQSLSAVEQAQALANIGALTASPDFVQGLTLANNTSDPNNRIDISAGSAKGQGLVVSSGGIVTKRLDAVWALGSGNGGLDVGSKAPGQTYHCHAIRNNSSGLLDGLLSLSAAAPSVPAGWSRVQRLGSVLTDAGGNIRPFKQTGSRVTLVTAITELTETSLQALSAVTLSSVPAGVVVRPILAARLSMSGATSISGFALYLTDGDNVTSGGEVEVADVFNSSNNSFVAVPVECLLTNSSRQVGRRTVAVGNNPTSPSFSLKGHGWTDISIPRLA